MTLDEARTHVGAVVTHHATGVIEAVTAQFDCDILPWGPS